MSDQIPGPKPEIPPRQKDEFTEIPTKHPSPIGELETPTLETPTPVGVPLPGDPQRTVGYVEMLKVDKLEKERVPGSSNTFVASAKTFCLITISSEADSAKHLKEFRISYKLLTGEELAVSMSLIAILKDAFISRSKVAIEYEKIVNPDFALDFHLEVKSIELLR